MTNIFAGIVTYNPDIELLKQNIEAISLQVGAVAISDNGSQNLKDILNLAEKYGVEVINNQANLGIAAALNRLMQWGNDNSYEWMVSLDQDSVCDKDFVKDMIPYLTVEPKMGIVAPIIVDRKVGVIGHNPTKEYQHVNTCITSGSIVNVNAWDEIGRYDEKMFIDSVDFEFCYRMRKAGYGVIQVRDVQLDHRIGESQERRFLLWKIRVSNHSAFRKYYIAQNTIYYPKKHHQTLKVIRGNLRNAWMIIKILLYEDSKSEKIRAVYRGWRNGYKLLNSRETM